MLSPEQAIHTYSQILEKKYKVNFLGTNGIKNFYNDKYLIYLDKDQALTLPSARRLLLEISEEFVRFRNSEAIDNPFSYKRIYKPSDFNISMGFWDKNGKRVPKNYVDQIFLTNGEIAYFISEKKFHDIIHKETYEEAMRIVQQSIANELSDKR